MSDRARESKSHRGHESESDESDRAQGAPLAYHNREFLDSAAARPIRILAEYLEPLDVFQRELVHDTIVFFGSARLKEGGPLSCYLDEARELARLVTEWSLGLKSPCHRFQVCTGGGGGIMEAANRGAREAGGRTIGLNIALPREQVPNPFISPELGFEFHYFFMRKLWFAHLARAVVVFPGGFGTMDELFEMLTLAQTRKLDRPMLILWYGSSYWNDVVNLDALARYGMIDQNDLKLFHRVDSPVEALAAIQKGLELDPGGTSPALARSAGPPRQARP